MKTLYIDVYFLINFTVDVLAIYFSAIFSKIPTTSKRLIFTALLGALIAVITVLLPEIPILKMMFSTVGLLLITFFTPKNVGLKRKIKFMLSFLIFEALMGGIVSLIWNILDKTVHKGVIDSGGGSVNRKMLFFSLIVLLCIGVFKMIVSFFSNIESEGSVEIEIDFLGKKQRIQAFIDSGNLAVDPMDMRPVLLLKKEKAKYILPENIIELSDPDALNRDIRKRIRLIPITRGGVTHVLTGIKADSVKIIKNGNAEELFVTVAIDKEGGTYGGYSALMPSAALDNVTV